MPGQIRCKLWFCRVGTYIGYFGCPIQGLKRADEISHVVGIAGLQ